MPRKNKFTANKTPNGNQQSNSQPIKKRRVGDKPQDHNTKQGPINPVETAAQILQTRRKPGETRQPPPPPPPSVPTSHTVLPPEADDAKVRNNHDLHTISVQASSKIESKVRQVLSALNGSKEAPDEGDDSLEKKPVIVALTARASAGNKCISIAEIAKRELGKSGQDCWQYTGCWSRLETVEAKSDSEDLEKSKDGQTKADEADDEAAGAGAEIDEQDEEPAFQNLEIPERTVVRNTVCLVIYLSGEPVARLKELYGEQMAEAKKKP
jgi:hypothetical protein